jgi:hypothetical protein
MEVSEVKRLRELEAENARLKRLLAETMESIELYQSGTASERLLPEQT